MTQQWDAIYVALVVCFGTICYFSNNTSHSVPHKTVQKVCLKLWISGVAYSAHNCGTYDHFRDSTRMELMVLVTSG